MRYARATVSDATHRFDDRATDYARHRPGYAPGLVPALRTARGLPTGALVADIGCGTGLLAESFLAEGCRVAGVEPSAPMRAQALARLGGDARFTCRDGRAEATGLPAGVAQAVVAGQAFHWFDAAAARGEFARILAPGGWVALVWNERLGVGSPLLAGYEELLVAHCPDYGPMSRREDGAERAAEFFGAGRVDAGRMATLLLDNPQSLDWEGFAGRARSASYVPAAGPGHAALFAALRALFDRHARGGRVDFTLRTVVFHGTLSG